MRISTMLAGGAALLAAALLAGCARPAGDGGATGTVHGTITMVGGPRGASPFGGGGTVVATKDGRQVARQDVAAGRQFSLRLPVGKYRLSVSGAGAPCEAATVNVAAGADQQVALFCSIK